MNNNILWNFFWRVSIQNIGLTIDELQNEYVTWPLHKRMCINIKKEIFKIYETVEAPNIVVKSALLEKALPNCL